MKRQFSDPHVQMAPGLIRLPRSYKSGFRLRTHVHREAQLLFAPAGVMEVTTPRGRWLVPPDRAVWLPPRIEHSIEVLADIEMRTLYFDPAFISGHAREAGLEREFVVVVRPLLRELVLTAFALGGNGGDGGDGADARRAEALMRLALFEMIEAEDAATFMPMPADARARRVAELVIAKHKFLTPLDDLARAAHTSARTVTRLFPAETRLTFKQWRQRARIMAAMAALSGGSPVKQVAASLGFSSVAAFVYAFRQVTGNTPGAFLRALAQI